MLAYLRDEAEAVALASAIGAANEAWVVDVVPAYASVAVFFDLDRIDFPTATDRVRQIHQAAARDKVAQGRLREIPCCYERGLDLERVAGHTRLATDKVIRLHLATTYAVYAIGFCPGFPYLGYLADRLAGVPRLETPRLRVEPGSVGLTGRQTGIYSLARPGGWNIVGQTPFELVNVADGYFPLRAGDQVRFQRIDEAEFRRLQGTRL